MTVSIGRLGRRTATVATTALVGAQGRTSMHQGQGQGLSQRFLGESSGVPSVTLIDSEMPAHAHATSGKPGNFPPPANNPTGNTWGSSNDRPWGAAASLVGMSPLALAISGGSQPHNNMMPFLTLNFCIALQGVFPQRP